MTFVLPGIIAALIMLRADLRRRRLTLTSSARWHGLSALDVLFPAVTVGIAAGLLFALFPSARHSAPLDSSIVRAAVAGVLIAGFLWSEGWRQLQFQRPRGIVSGEWLILAGGYLLLESTVLRGLQGLPGGTTVRTVGGLAIAAGGALTAAIVIPFVRKYEGLRILERVTEEGESVQREYSQPTAECPQPELWRMLDSQSTEVEVIDLLRSLVTALKPRLIVETGTFLGHSTIKMAEGLKENGFGRIITIEYDPAIFAKANERIEASGLSDWIENRNESSLESRIEGTIDILFSDSHLTIREQEIRRLLPQIDPRGLIVVHDASSHFQVVREVMLRLEAEGLVSVVLLPTPRGVAIAQKREGRK